MIGHDAQREIRELVIAIVAAAQALSYLDEAMEDVGVEIGAHALHDGGHALEAEARIDVLLLERNHRAVFLAVKLRKDEVPVFEEAIAIAAGLAIRAAAANVLALVIVELGARTAGAGGAGNPEVIVGAKARDVVRRDANLLPDVGGLLVLLVDRDIDAIGVETEHVDGELIGPGAHFLLEVCTEAEVAEHLEEREVTAIRANDVDVIGAHALLCGGRAHVAGIEVLLLQEVGLELHHARNGEQQGWVIGDERGRWPALAAFFLEEIQVCLANLCGRDGFGRHDAPCLFVLL